MEAEAGLFSFSFLAVSCVPCLRSGHNELP